MVGSSAYLASTPSRLPTPFATRATVPHPLCRASPPTTAALSSRQYGTSTSDSQVYSPNHVLLSSPSRPHCARTSTKRSRQLCLTLEYDYLLGTTHLHAWHQTTPSKFTFTPSQSTDTGSWCSWSAPSSSALPGAQVRHHLTAMTGHLQPNSVHPCASFHSPHYRSFLPLFEAPRSRFCQRTRSVASAYVPSILR